MSVLTDAALYALTVRHFGDLGQDVVNTMFNIAKAESGGNSAAYNGKGRDNSHGLWQINTIQGANPDLLSMNLNDPEQNAQAARIVYDRQGPTAWSTYGGGKVPEKTNKQKVEDAITGLLGAQPDPSEYPDPLEYQAASAQWDKQMGTLVSLRKSYRDAEAGIYTLASGQVLTQSDIDALNPEERAVVETELQNQNVDRDNTFSQTMDAMGLSDWNTAQSGVEAENTRGSNDFQNKLDSWREGLNLDKANQNTAIQRVSREVSGKAEASKRASDAMDALLKAAPWATSNGKTQFSPADMGQAGMKLAQYGGLTDMNSPALGYTGYMNIDPNAMFNQLDEQMGVSGPLSQIPDLTTQPGSIPNAPQSTPIRQGSPSHSTYTRPATVQVPQGKVPPPPNINDAAANVPLTQDQLYNKAVMALMARVGGKPGPVNQPAWQAPPFPTMPKITPLTTLLANRFGMQR